MNFVELDRKRVLRDWAKWDAKLYKKRDKNLIPQEKRKRNIEYFKIGKMILERWYYKHKTTGKYVFLLDVHKGFEKRIKWMSEIKEKVKKWKKDFFNVSEMKYMFKEFRVSISKSTLSRLLKRLHFLPSPKNEQKHTLPKNIFYWCVDEGYITLWNGNKYIKYRGRLTSSCVGSDKRGRLLFKEHYLSLHEPGEQINTVKYWSLLKELFEKDYDIKQDTLIFGSSDNASNMRKLLEISQCIPQRSLFHWKQQQAKTPEAFKEEYKHDPRAEVHYWLESSIAHILKRDGEQGFNLWSIDTYVKYQKERGVRIIKYIS